VPSIEGVRHPSARWSTLHPAAHAALGSPPNGVRLYDDFTLKAAQFPDLGHGVDYDDSVESIVNAVTAIHTPRGL
jgi:hypothetical protein